MAKRKNLFLFTCSNQVTHQRTGDTCQCIDDNGNSAETLLTMFDTANSVSPKRSIATKNRNQMATLVKNWSILHTEIENTSFNTVISIRQYKPYAFLSMCRNIYAANTASEHISADEEAIAAPDIPISKPKIRSQFSGMFTSTAVKAAMFRAFVCVMPTKTSVRQGTGKRTTIPKYANPNSG